LRIGNRTSRRNNRAKGAAAAAFIMPSLLGITAFLIVPFFDVVRRSFMNNQATQIIGLDNYGAVLTNEAFRIAAGNTLRFTVVCVPLLVASSFILAVLLKEKTPFANIFKTGLLLPLAIPVTAAAILWGLLFDPAGLVNGVLDKLGMDPIDWMDSGAAFWVLVGCYLWKNLGYCVILWLAALSTIPQNVYEAARMDGASRLQSISRITIPLVMPSFFVVFVIALINSFKVYREAYLVAGSYPHESIYLLQHLFNNWFMSMSLGRLAAGGVLLFVVVLALTFFLYRSWGLKDEVSR
jgi:multiple sugar transport system permease protein